MDPTKLNEILAAHAKWTMGGPDGERANLQGAHLLEADLYHADLLGANLREANLYHANLRDANLRGADLRDAHLQGAHLRGADLREANLAGADLIGANLEYADLRHANLRDADLLEANLYHANLRCADLREANLIGAVLDFSVWPLWCGSKWVITDDRLKIQLLAHVAVMKGEITDPDLAALLGSDLFHRVVKKCHRAQDLGLDGAEDDAK